jgi:hypothetical protein
MAKCYVIYDGKRHCGIEQAYNQGAIDWKNLFPVIYILFALKISLNLLLSIMTSGIFDPACSLGQELGSVYKFVKEALVRRFGEDWYLDLKKWPGHEK